MKREMNAAETHINIHVVRSMANQTLEINNNFTEQINVQLTLHGVLQSLPIVLPMMIPDLDTLHSHRLCTLEWLHRRAASDWRIRIVFLIFMGHRSPVVQ